MIVHVTNKWKINLHIRLLALMFSLAVSSAIHVCRQLYATLVYPNLGEVMLFSNVSQVSGNMLQCSI